MGEGEGQIGFLICPGCLLRPWIAIFAADFVHQYWYPYMCSLFFFLSTYCKVQSVLYSTVEHGLSQNLETGCPNEGFIDFWVSKVWYNVHTTN